MVNMFYYIKPLSGIGVLSGILAGTFAVYNYEELKLYANLALRFGHAAVTVSQIVHYYQSNYYFKKLLNHTPLHMEMRSLVHKRAAEKLLALCCANGGAFIKVGQHLGALDYLIPIEYVSTLKVLHSEAPIKPLEEVLCVISEELKSSALDLFAEFDPQPLGSASLAQVHRALLKDGREVAVKVQHKKVKEYASIDMKGMELLVSVVGKIFPEFKFKWLVDEMKRNLPLELDFKHEGNNAERLAEQYKHFSWFKVPFIHWDLSTDRILVMEYINGGKVTDLNYYKCHNINPVEVCEKLGLVYSEMIFKNGYVHCDPHPGNLLIRKNGSLTDIVMLDHGLYVSLDDQFRLNYSNLWQSVLEADLNSVEKYGKQLGVGELFGLFACMVTARSWDSISKGIDKRKKTHSEEQEIKDDATKYLYQISEVLSRVPREMLLILKTNDLLRGIEYSLNTEKKHLSNHMSCQSES